MEYFLLQHIFPAVAKRAVGEHGFELFHMAHADHGRAAEFGIVADKEDAARTGYDGTGHGDFAVIVVEQIAFLIDAGNTIYKMNTFYGGKRYDNKRYAKHFPRLQPHRRKV